MKLPWCHKQCAALVMDRGYRSDFSKGCNGKPGVSRCILGNLDTTLRVHLYLIVYLYLIAYLRHCRYKLASSYRLHKSSFLLWDQCTMQLYRHAVYHECTEIPTNNHKQLLVSLCRMLLVCTEHTSNKIGMYPMFLTAKTGRWEGNEMTLQWSVLRDSVPCVSRFNQMRFI